ncbi:MAG: MFS transporter [Colwellia sp.]|nr:MFS transporter [Colwellia sp.]
MNSSGRAAILAISFAHFVVATPMIYAILALPLILASQGYGGDTIGLLQLVALPAILKLLLAVPIEKIRLAGNQYKNWSLLLLGCYSLVLAIIATLSLKEDLSTIVALLTLTALLATFVDIPLSALSIKQFNPCQHMQLASFKAAALFIASITGGGLLLLCYSYYGWFMPLALMSLLSFIAFIALTFITEVPDRLNKTAKLSASFTDITSFFAQAHSRLWIILLLSYFSFISAGWVYIKPLLLTKGFSTEQLAISVGILGGFVGIFASLVGNKIAHGYGKGCLLKTAAIVNLTCFIYGAILLTVEAASSYYYLLIILLASGLGLASAVMFAFIMQHSRPHCQAIDYSLQMTLMTLARILIAVLAGIIIKLSSYTGLFVFLSFAMLWVTYISWLFANKVNVYAAKTR